jgi:serine/threonine protein kinase/Tol biopolymer transport system component
VPADQLDRLRAALADRYHIERELGQGGMATVYQAEDLKHHRKVAVKVLRPELAAALGPERFLREITTTANLRHPHILPLYDSGESTGFLYYVMPLVEGESLRDRLTREKQLPVDEALRLIREVADALGYAHSQGIIHRDIKPENILLERGHAVVADFGIARAVASAGAERLTATGLSVGTPAYMSPEQAAGERDLDGRSDLYALSCVLYEMLAGQPPFTGPTVESVVRQHLSATPPLITQIRPAVPSVVATAIERGLAKNPADRFSSAGQFAEALATQQAIPTQVPSSLASPRRQRAIGATVVGVMVLLGAVVFLMRRGTPTAVHLGRQTQVTLDPGLEIDPALSPDGKFLAYSGQRGELMVRQVENGVPLRVAREGDATGRWPAWLPDGQRLVFVSPRGIEIVSALGGVPRLLVAGTGLGRGVAVSPDGRSFVYASNDSLYRRPVDGGEARLVTVGREVHSFAWSPDARWIAYVSGNIQYVKLGDLGNVALSSIWVTPATAGPSTQVTDSQSMNVSPAWAGPRSLLYVSNRDGSRDVYRIELTGSGTPAKAPVRLTTGLNAYGIGISLDGSRLAYAAFTETSNVWSIPIPTTGAVSVSLATAVTAGNQIIENFDVSPDGQWLAFSSIRGDRGQLYRMPLGRVGAEPQQLTTDTAGSYWAAWSPNEKEIAFNSFRGERRLEFVISAEGGVPTQVTDGREDERSAEWSPDGRRLLLLANWGTKPELHMFTRKPDGSWSGPRAVPIMIGSDTVAAGLASWSPDGRVIACGCGPGGLVIIPVEGGTARRLTSPYSTDWWDFPQWSADGRTVFHVTQDSGRVAAVIAVPVSGAAPRVVVRFDDPTRPWHRYGFRVRGERFFFTLGDQESDIWVAELGGGGR